MNPTQPKSRTRIVVKNKEFLVTYSHNDKELAVFNAEKQKLANLVKESGIAKRIPLTAFRNPLPKTTCDIFVGEIGTTKAEKTTMFSGVAIKHKNDHNNRCIARSVALDHVLESEDFTKFLTENDITTQEFKEAALSTLGLRYVKTQN